MSAKHNSFAHEYCEKQICFAPIQHKQLKIDVNMDILRKPYHLSVFSILNMGIGMHDMSPEVHCNLCNKCYTLGIPGPRPDIRCVQYLPKVHPKVPIEFLVPSGASEVID